jgi:SAM-dependent methyltransferase
MDVIPGRIARAPAAKAALIQLLALLPLSAIAWLLARSGVALPIAVIALLQGAIAALITWKVGLAPWWRLIELLFPLALLGAHSLHLPPNIFLLLFVLLLGMYWSTFRTQVPFYPSSPSVWNAVAQLLPAHPVRVIDIGSGLGGLALALARMRPDAQFCGIELAPLPWLFSRLRALLSGSAARFVRGDYERLDFSHYDVVFAYLSPAAMDALWCKAEREMRPGTMLLSYEFGIDARRPDRIIAVSPSGPALYVWDF